MRILDEDRDKAVERVTIFLTPAEAGELRDFLSLLITGEADHHIHVADSEYERELTVAIYDSELGSFNERARRLIETGE